MGMYDDIVCKYPLPLPEDTKGYTLHGFQTKDLECALDLYEIREDGSLWLKHSESEFVKGNPDAKSLFDRIGHMKEIRSWWEHVKLTKTIQMYDYHHTDGPYDYSVEFEVVFVGGVIDKIKLIKFDTLDNIDRKELHKHHIEGQKLRRKFESSIFYRLIGKPYNSIIRFIFKSIYKVSYFVVSRIWKWENKLSI